MIFSLTYKTALKELLKHEGGYVNDLDDTGGETIKGISRVFFPHWEGWLLVDNHKRLNLPTMLVDINTDKCIQKLVEIVYYDYFWSKLKLNKVISKDLATQMFNKSVNMGIRQLVKLLQSALNVIGSDLVVDGLLGNKTILEINKYKKYKRLVLKTLKGELYLFYKGLATKSVVKRKYIKGWILRI